MANSLPPAPIDNDPEPGSDQAKKKLRAWISTPTWGAFKTWFDTIFKILKGFSTDNAGNVTLNGNLTIDGALNGLPPQDYTGQGGNLLMLAPAVLNKTVTVTTGVVGVPNTVLTTIGSVVLSPGIWMVGGNWTFSPAGVASWGAIVIGITGVATTTLQTAWLGTLANVPMGIQIVTVTGPSPQTFNIGAQANYTPGSMTAQAFVWAVPIPF